MAIRSEELIQDLIERTEINISKAEGFRNLSVENLNRRVSIGSWSILECLEHLNLYGDFYIPEIRLRITSAGRPPQQNFRPGLLGDYFAKSMLPKEKLNTMKTFKDKDPIGSTLDTSTIERFISQQEQLIDLLGSASNIDLNKTKTAISISSLIKLKIGDTFRVVVYHNERHIVQAEKLKK